MLSDFFQLGPIPADQMTGSFDLRIVFLSYVVAFFASYIALDITGRLRDVNNTPLSNRLWICGGALAMGAGIWSMHFIGMLAFTMPGMYMAYELSWTLLSLLVAIVASAFALYLLSAREIHVPRLALGGIVLGIGIASMHYLGMQGMTDSMNIHYLPGLFVLSIVIAIAASEAALWFALKSNQVIASLRVRLKVISALIMGAAICGMHYTGMFAAVFTPIENPVRSMVNLPPEIVAICIAIITSILIGIAFFVSAKKEAQNEQLLQNAHAAGMAEVAITVLHNVGNVLNSVNVSANIIEEHIRESKLSMLDGVLKLMTEHETDLGNFITNDEKGKRIPSFIRQLNEYWLNEQKILGEETQGLLKNLQHIKEIIAMQQNMSKKLDSKTVTAIDVLIDEALLICSIDKSRHNIIIEKDITKFKAVFIDKVKLLQILVNLIQNAKDSLKKSNVLVKKLIIRSGLEDKSNYFIEIQDNGTGISSANLRKMFTHGFTTKENGHGFGLHASSLAAKDMGGSIKVASDGENKGASFRVILPYRLPS